MISLSAFNHKPRQFEIHPSGNHILYGTIDGSCYLSNRHTQVVTPLGRYGRTKRDPILGICWLKREENNSKFIIGSGLGQISLGSTAESVYTHSAIKAYNHFPTFTDLTSVHVNSDDSILLVSGYVSDVMMYDVETGQPVSTLTNIHQDHINISRFSNLTPTLFATCSLDGSAKLWDSRCLTAPIHKLTSQHTAGGILMMIFSPCDNYLLASAVDNEVVQYHVYDGREMALPEIPKLNRNTNFTRSYYSASGELIFSGSTGADVLSVVCASSGQLLSQRKVFPGRRSGNAYIQSLRGDPVFDSSACCLVNYQHSSVGDLILLTDLQSVKRDSDCIATKRSSNEAGENDIQVDPTKPTQIISQTLPGSKLFRELKEHADTKTDLLLVLPPPCTTSSVYWGVTGSVLNAIVPKVYSMLQACTDQELCDAEKTWSKSSFSDDAICIKSDDVDDGNHTFKFDCKSLIAFSSLMISHECSVNHICSMVTFITKAICAVTISREEILQLYLEFNDSGHDEYIFFLLDLVLLMNLFDMVESIKYNVFLHVESLLTPANVFVVVDVAKRKNIDDNKFYAMLLRYIIIHYDVIRLYISLEEMEQYINVRQMEEMRSHLSVRADMKRQLYVHTEFSTAEDYVNNNNDIMINGNKYIVKPIPSITQYPQCQSRRLDHSDLEVLDVQHPSIEFENEIAIHSATFTNNRIRFGSDGNDEDDDYDNAHGAPDVMMVSLIEHRAVRLTDECLLFYDAIHGLYTFSLKTSTFSALTSSDKLPHGLHHFDTTIITLETQKYMLLAGGNISPPTRPFMHALDIAQLKYVNVSITQTYMDKTEAIPRKLGGNSVVCLPRTSLSSMYETVIVYGGYNPETNNNDSAVHVVRLHKNHENDGEDGIIANWYLPNVERDERLWGTWGHSAVLHKSGEKIRMVVFGGVARTGLTNNVCVLRCEELCSSSVAFSASSVYWEPTRASSVSPSPRIKHAMAFVESTNEIIVFGGEGEVDGNRQLFHDLWILTLHDKKSGITDDLDECLPLHWRRVEWDAVNVGMDQKFLSKFGYTIAPCTNDGEIVLYLFSAHTQNYLKINLSSKVESREVPFLISPTIETCFDLERSKYGHTTDDYFCRLCGNEKSNEFLDLLLITHGHYRMVNGAIFRARSEVFERIIARTKLTPHTELFSILEKYNIQELVNYQQPIKVITFPNIENPIVLDLVVKFIYTDTLSVYDVNDALSIMFIAHEFHIVRLMQLCEHALSRCADKTNCMNLLCYAQEYSMEHLYTICVSIIHHNIDYLVENGLLNDKDCVIDESSPIVQKISAIVDSESRKLQDSNSENETNSYEAHEDVFIGKDRKQLTMTS